jgi:carbonic anhydrase/acetyltransferase-like protein (isoleucine patch superfamily)
MPDIQENTFIYSFTVVIGYCSVRKLIVVAPNAVFRGGEERFIRIDRYVSKS